MRRLTFVVALLLVTAPTVVAHDLFLKLTDYFLTPGQRVTAAVLNGTFTTSENTVTRDRVRDISLVSAGARKRLDSTAWSYTRDSKASRLTFSVAAPGTYVLGASTLPRELEMDGKEFNSYLEEEGLSDVLDTRRGAGELEKRTRERYAKHVKAIVQVGAARTNDVSAALGYPAEIVPVENPYSLAVGAALSVRCLTGGWPVAGVTVLAGGRSATGARIPEQKVRAGEDGVARITLTSAGTWYVKFIRMERRPGDTVDYQSNWATLTFAVR
jgi:uncharacterized GH25 family protein